MSQIIGYKCRIYPNKQQEQFLAKHFGTTRYLYNHCLAYHSSMWKEQKISVNYYGCIKKLQELKNDPHHIWLKEINSQSCQQALKHLQDGFERFFKKQNRYPQFKKKHDKKQSASMPQHCSVKNNKLHIPKLKQGIKIVLHRDFDMTQIDSVVISRSSSGKYYAAFKVEKEIKHLPKSNSNIGIDLNIKNLVKASDGTEYKNEKFYAQAESKLKHHQRLLSRKVKGSNNRNKERKILAVKHEKVASCRRNRLHQISRKLINENQVIVAEGLKVKNMMRNHCLAKSIADCGWGELLRQLKYKAAWYGRTFHQIDTFFASSKLCCLCGCKNNNLKLSDRNWTCLECGAELDRDLNAAINIKNEGLRELSILAATHLATECSSDVKQKLAEASVNAVEAQVSAGKPSRRVKKPLALC